MKSKHTFLFVALLTSILLLSAVESSLASQSTTNISNPENNAVYPQAVVDSSGYIHVVWMEVRPDQPAWFQWIDNPGIFYSMYNGNAWSEPLRISENSALAEIPSIAIDSTDTIHVTWDDATYGPSQSSYPFSRAVYRKRSPNGTWSSIEILPIISPTASDFNVRIKIDDSDVPHVTFANFADGGIYWSRKIAGAWTTPEIVSKDEAENNIVDTQWSMLDRDNSGNLHLAYWSFSQGIFYRKHTAGTWLTAVPITSTGGWEYPILITTPTIDVHKNRLI